MQRHSVTSLETACSLANGPIVAGGWGGIPRELQRLLSLIGYDSIGGVCGRSLTAGKILFTGRQTCSLYLVLRLCGKHTVNCFTYSLKKTKVCVTEITIFCQISLCVFVSQFNSFFYEWERGKLSGHHRVLDINV